MPALALAPVVAPLLLCLMIGITAIISIVRTVAKSIADVRELRFAMERSAPTQYFSWRIRNTGAQAETVRVKVTRPDSATRLRSNELTVPLPLAA